LIVAKNGGIGVYNRFRGSVCPGSPLASHGIGAVVLANGWSGFSREKWVACFSTCS